MGIRILAFCGSSRAGSFNRKLLEVAVQGAHDAGAEVTTVPSLAVFELPLYDGDLEIRDGLPPGAVALQRLLEGHDALLVATPEYNGGYPAVLKNGIDWMSRPRPDKTLGTALFAGKPAAVMSASPGQFGGLRSQLAFRGVLEKLGMVVIPDALALGHAHEAFADDGRLREPGIERQAMRVGAALARFASRMVVQPNVTALP